MSRWLQAPVPEGDDGGSASHSAVQLNFDFADGFETIMVLGIPVPTAAVLLVVVVFVMFLVFVFSRRRSERRIRPAGLAHGDEPPREAGQRLSLDDFKASSGHDRAEVADT